MNNEKSVNLGVASIISLSSAGGFLIGLPLSSDDGSDILALVISVILSFGLIALLYKPLGAVYSAKPSNLSQAVCLAAVYVISLALLAGIAVFSLIEFSQYAKEIMLPSVQIGVVFLITALLAFYITTKGITAFGKTALIFAVLTLVLGIVVFLFSIPKMSVKYLIPTGFPSLKNALYTSVLFYLKSFGQTLFPMFIIGGKQRDIKSSFIGNALGGVLVAFGLLNTVLIFGGGFASTLDYPYTSAVSTVNLGNIFSRMDGFLYVMIFFCSIIKISFIFYCIKILSDKINELKIFYKK